MKKLLLILISSFVSSPLRADSPGTATEYKRFSENGSFFFKSIPFHDYEYTDLGKTIVYSKILDKEIYTINKYLPLTSFITNDGGSLVTIKEWSFVGNIDDDVLVEIFVRGKKNIQYYKRDFLTKNSKLTHSSSHTSWYMKVYVSKDILYILTLDKRLVKIDLCSGKIIYKGKKNYKKCISHSLTISEPLTIQNNSIVYPQNYVFPNLENGIPFRQSLLDFLDLDVVEEYDSCKYYILIYAIIDTLGNCEIFKLKTSVDRIENKQWENEVKAWVVNQRYKTYLIPENCDKWVFKEYFYLK